MQPGDGTLPGARLPPASASRRPGAQRRLRSIPCSAWRAPARTQVHFQRVGVGQKLLGHAQDGIARRLRHVPKPSCSCTRVTHGTRVDHLHVCNTGAGVRVRPGGGGLARRLAAALAATGKRALSGQCMWVVRALPACKAARGLQTSLEAHRSKASCQGAEPDCSTALFQPIGCLEDHRGHIPHSQAHLLGSQRSGPQAAP